MKLIEFLVGKKINFLTEAKIVVQLEIESIEPEHHSEDLGPSTPANDWWPPTRDWTTYKVKFSNGFYKSYNNLSDIDIVE